MNINKPEYSFAAGRGWIVAGAVLASVAVVLGSIGAHGLERMIAGMDDIPKRIENWNTGVRYHMVHCLGLILIGLILANVPTSRLISLAAWLMLLGMGLFSGCLYGWVFLDNRVLVMIVPLGGLAFILGWFSLAVGVWISKKGSPSNV